MKKIIYIALLVVLFSGSIWGIEIPFFLKYGIGILISTLCILPQILKDKKIKGHEYFCLKTYLLPIILIVLWSFLIWIISPPENLSLSNVTRMFSNCLNLILSITVAISTIKVLGKDAVKYSVIAIAISIIINILYTISVYGIGLFLEYIPQAAFSTDFQYGSDLFNIGVQLEVQDATLAAGFYFLYFILFDEKSVKKEKIKYLLILSFCSYIGFKRTQFLSIILTICILLLMKKFKVKNIIRIVGTTFLIFCFGYVCIVKFDIFSDIVNLLGADVTGRTNIFKWLSEYFELSILYIGKGFTYVDKTMFELTGFASHNTIVRMYAELGCIPFIIWLYWYLIKIPKKVLKKQGNTAGKITFACVLYLFLTYCIGNSMNFFCIQYSFILIQLALIYNENNKVREIEGENNENCDFINAKSI